MNSIGKPRVEWIDVAKALSILLVTMLHVGQLAQQSDIQVGRIVALNDFLAPIRMPLFFAASGVFAGSALAKPWSHLLRHKVALYAWLFIIWTSVRWLFCGFALPNPGNPDEGSSILEIAWALIMPTTGLWFLWCLGIFFVLAKALRPLNPRLTLVAAVVVSIVSLVIADGPAQADGSGLLGNLAHRNSVRYFVFFYGAAVLPHLVTGLGGWKLLPGIIGTLVAFIGCYALSRFMGDPISAVARFGASLAGVALLFLCARPLDAIALPSKVLRYLGVNTLPIYVAQVPLIIIYLTVLKAVGFDKLGFLGNMIVPIGVILVVVLSLQLRRLLIRLGAGFMYRLPHFDRPVTPAGTAAA